jgi:hypothetical protein
VGLAESFSYFKQRLELDPSYQTVIEARHAAVRDCIERAIPGAETHLIGSLQRRTRIDPPTGLEDFDIDILVVLGRFDHWVPVGDGSGNSPDRALDRIEAAVRTRLFYRRLGIEQDRPAIVLPYDDGSRVEVVPAFRDDFPDSFPRGRAYWVPRTNEWHRADYDYDAQVISATNQANDGLLIPCIKMLKAWRRNLVPLLRSYHLEVLALNSFPIVLDVAKRNAAPTWPMLLQGFFQCAAEDMRRGVTIRGSLSEPPDYYLSPVEREAIAAMIQKCHEASLRYSTASDSVALQGWRSILGRPFPA